MSAAKDAPSAGSGRMRGVGRTATLPGRRACRGNDCVQASTLPRSGRRYSNRNIRLRLQRPPTPAFGQHPSSDRPSASLRGGHLLPQGEKDTLPEPLPRTCRPIVAVATSEQRARARLVLRIPRDVDSPRAMRMQGGRISTLRRFGNVEGFDSSCGRDGMRGLRSFAPPSVLPDISPARGEIGSFDVSHQFCSVATVASYASRDYSPFRHALFLLRFFGRRYRALFCSDNVLAMVSCCFCCGFGKALSGVILRR